MKKYICFTKQVCVAVMILAYLVEIPGSKNIWTTARPEAVVVSLRLAKQLVEWYIDYIMTARFLPNPFQICNLPVIVRETIYSLILTWL
jgi:hypothetical protein